MRILLLSQWFQPEPAFKGLPFARALQARGHVVEVLTGFPNYPGGVVYPGYAVRRRADEVMEGIPVHRVWLYPNHDRSALKRVINYFSFAVSAALQGARAVTRRPDVIYAYLPPATIGIPAMMLSRMWKVPYVLDVQDLWPDTVAASGMLAHPLLLRPLEAFCRMVYRNASHVTVLSDGFRETLIERGVPAGRVTVIRNWSSEETPVGVDDGLREQLGLTRAFVVLFAGTMGPSQGLDAVLDAAERCRESLPDVVFVFVGGGIDRDALEQRASGMSNVRFLPRRRPDEMPPLLAMADVLLVHLRDDPLFRITIPSKTQAYMAAGRPILMAVRGNAAQLVGDASAGITALPDSPESIVAAVEQFVRMSAAERTAMGQSGRAYYDQQLSMQIGISSFERVFSRVTGLPLPSGLPGNS